MKTLYQNGNILTMQGKKPHYVDAVLVEKGRIKKIGRKEELQNLMDGDTKVFDLKGKTMLPSFMDSHSHVTALAQTLSIANLTKCTNFEEMVEELKQYKEEKKIADGDWIIGFGYDHNFLEEKKHPDCTVLDKANLNNPVLITHASGHMGVVNSIGLEKLGITSKTKEMEGGKFGRKEGTNEPNGYIEEKAFIEISKKIDLGKQEILERALEDAQQVYLQNGITTVQDGLTKKPDFLLLQKLAKQHKLKVDVICYPEFFKEREIVKENPNYSCYQNRLKIGGYKIVLDGSPQGRTAWLSEPYEGEKEYRGYPSYSDEEVKEAVHTSLKEKKQLLAHCNGDAASEQLIKAFLEEKQEIETRPVMIHAQTVRKDQLEKMKQLSMIPSFFIAHVFYWGDIHLKNLGKRAYYISPAKEAIKLGLPYTFHQDTPVIMPNMLETIWCATNRVTKEGVVLGKGERITVYEALEGVTKNVAYQYFEEKEKGTIEEGKLADFVILDQNPLQVEKEKIKEIQVLATIKEGAIVYQKGEEKK